MTTSAVKTRFRTIGGVRIRFAESDRPGAPALLLTSPWPESIHAFSPMWETLAEHARLFAIDLLPGLSRTIGGVLPPGASVDLARSALFFDGARIAGPILVLVGWAVLGTVLALVLGGRVMDPADVEAAAAAGAAV